MSDSSDYEMGLQDGLAKAAKLLAAVKLARLFIKDTLIEGAVISLEHPSVGLGGYLDAVIAEIES